MQPFRNLEVWQKAHALTLNVYRVTSSFPKEEAFGLSVQLRRNAMTISMRIAEGCGKSESLEFTKCLQLSRANGVELEYLLLLSHDLDFMNANTYDALQAQVIEVRKMLSGLIKTASL